MKMWANKLGLEHYNEALINDFFNLMVISIVIIVLLEVIPWIMAPLDSVNYLIQDFNHGQVEVNISHFLTNLLQRQSTLKHSVPLLVRYFHKANKIKKS